ncbi:MAG TPA: hypothetical protein VFT29_01785 [Gemmatimonadaceae bacterium]|nr:hypothetical protein [Gemmatimonadaceae bacterium]
MRFRSIATSFAVLLVARALDAQSVSPLCPGGTAQEVAVQDACQQAVDFFSYMRPQLGIAIAGGNTTLGQGGALGGFPHFAVSLRVNAVRGNVPNVESTRFTGASPSRAIETEDTFLGLPAADVAIGVFKGFPLGMTNVGGIDLLVSASYVPKLDVNGSSGTTSVEPDSPLQIGYGARVGIIQESLLMPGVGVSILRRSLPKTTITGVLSPSNDSLSVRDLDLKATSWRITASKSLVLFTIAAGVGQDTYDASTTIAAVVHGVPVLNRVAMNPVALEGQMRRTNYFANLSANIVTFKLIAETGMVSGGNATTFNTFSTEANASRLYGSLGIRFGL